MQSFLRALSIKAIIITVLVCFALLLSAVATLGYINGTLSRKELNIQIRNTSRIALLSDADRMRLRTTILIRGRETTAFFDKPMDAQQKKKHQEAIQHLFEASHRSLAEFRALPPFPDEEGRKLLEEAATVLNDVLIGLDSQYQAWLEGDAEAYHEREDKFKSLGYGPKISKAMADATSYFKSYSDQHQAAHHASLMRFFTVGSVLLVVAALLLLALRAMLLGLVVRPVHEAVGHVQRLARADLSQAIPVGSGNEIGQLLGALREMQDSLVRIVGSVRAGSGSILVGAQQIAGGNADLSSRTEQQAASLEETAASMEELTATVKQNADNARQASALANDASGTAGQGREVVGRVVETMREISDSSQQIAKIVGVIDSIAFQTNILALNASVEAARAGEQGRGFAVVAGEVRNLAGRSAEAAREIKALIEASTKRVGDGSQLAEQAGRTMEEVVRSVQRVTDIIDEISAASHEQSEGLGQVNTAVAQMDEVTQQNAALVQEASAASSSLAEQARHLEEAVAVFRLSAEQQRAQPQEVRGERRAASQPAQASRAEKHQPSPAKERARPAAAVAEEQWEEF